METLKIGSRGESIKILQIKLQITADGIFGTATEKAVKEFQRIKGLTVDGIVGPKTWAALESAVHPLLKKSKRSIKEIIIHCSDTPEGKDFTVDDIRRWHIAQKYSDIGYHYVIYRDGSVHLGRDVDVAGAHCLNHNSISIGICYIGGRAAVGTSPKDTRTPEQKESLISLLNDLRKLYPKATIHGHKEFANKACPCFEVRNEYKTL